MEIDLQKERSDYFARGYNEGWEAHATHVRNRLTAIVLGSIVFGMLLAQLLDKVGR